MKELSNNIKDKIAEIINNCDGMIIGTGLKNKLEIDINNILPGEYKYEFSFNMIGETSHLILNDGNVLYRF